MGVKGYKYLKQTLGHDCRENLGYPGPFKAEMHQIWHKIAVKKKAKSI